MAEVLELAGNVARDHRMGFIRPRDINLAVSSDEELAKLFATGAFANAGVTPNIDRDYLDGNVDKSVLAVQLDDAGAFVMEDIMVQAPDGDTEYAS